MKQVITLEPKYRVTMLTREKWTPGFILRLKGSSGLRMGPGLRRGPGLGSMGNLQTEG